jgi:MFS family permease
MDQSKKKRWGHLVTRTFIQSLSMKGRAVALIALCEVMTLSLWFSATAVLPALKLEGHLDAFHSSLFTSLVSVGFVFGTLVSALLGLADRLEPNHFFRVSAWAGALANLGLLVFPPSSATVLACRFATGVCMAGVYPVGMKMVATWAKGDMGLLVGILVGALTLGSASPHLFNALGGLDWRVTVGLATASAAAAGWFVGWVQLGPNRTAAPPFQPRYVLQAWRNTPLRLANFGYFGHQWEIYAMWAWIGSFLNSSFALSGAPAVYASIVTFTVIGIGGGLGCLIGGVCADRLGRTTVTMVAMATSGTCALTVGLLYGADWRLTGGLCLVWGVAVVADSAQFSSSVIELSDPAHVGTMLTTQTCAGFLLTLVTIQLVPLLVDVVGWPWAFAALAPGPFLGVVAMGMLRRRPEAARLADGRG